MSNNPFLSKSTSNRFMSLDDSSNYKNTFTNSKSNNNRFNTLKEKTNTINKPYVKTNFKPDHNKNDVSNKSPTFDDNIEMFPKLNENSNENVTQAINDGKPDFKNIIINNNEDDINETNVNLMLPGWVEITKVNNKANFDYKGPTPVIIKLENDLALKQNLNTLMNDTITIMKQKWDNYEEYYNDLHGEGEYERCFRLKPIYDFDINDFDNIDYEEPNDVENENDIN